jgi:hypothetical protein
LLHFWRVVFERVPLRGGASSCQAYLIPQLQFPLAIVLCRFCTDNLEFLDLKIKPVHFAIELFVVLEHGRRANLCLARFTQTRGAASSFRKVVDIVEDVCRARCMLVEDTDKQATMLEVLD